MLARHGYCCHVARTIAFSIIVLLRENRSKMIKKIEIIFIRYVWHITIVHVWSWYFILTLNYLEYYWYMNADVCFYQLFSIIFYSVYELRCISSHNGCKYLAYQLTFKFSKTSFVYFKNHEISIENANSQLVWVILINSSSTSILTRFILLQTHPWALKHETMHKQFTIYRYMMINFW